jgi:hypothetical protein
MQETFLGKDDFMSPKIRISSVVALCLFAASVASLQAFAAGPLDANLDGLTARQAVALANKWSEAKLPVKTFINPREIVFDFGNGKTRRIPLPADEMMIAIAPYVQRTHP